MLVKITSANGIFTAEEEEILTRLFGNVIVKDKRRQNEFLYTEIHSLKKIEKLLKELKAIEGITHERKGFWPQGIVLDFNDKGDFELIIYDSYLE